MKTIPSSVTSRTTGAVIAPLSLGPAEVLPLDFVLGLAYDQLKNARKQKKTRPTTQINDYQSQTKE